MKTKILAWCGRIRRRIFGCDHAAHLLEVHSEPTVAPMGAHFERVISHFTCSGCGAEVSVNYTRPRGGWRAFNRRAKRTI